MQCSIIESHISLLLMTSIKLQNEMKMKLLKAVRKILILKIAFWLRCYTLLLLTGSRFCFCFFALEGWHWTLATVERFLYRAKIEMDHLAIEVFIQRLHRDADSLLIWKSQCVIIILFVALRDFIPLKKGRKIVVKNTRVPWFKVSQI